MGLFEPTNQWETSDVAAREEAIKQAAAWVAENPQKRYYSPIAPTGSMKPDFDENSIVCIELDDGKNIKNGDLVTYKASEKLKKVIHKVSALNDRAFIPNGTANGKYDGWKPRSSVNGIARKIIRFKPVVTETAEVKPNP